jgi:hypothetical protein
VSAATRSRSMRAAAGSIVVIGGAYLEPRCG